MMSDTADKNRTSEPMSEGEDDLFKGTDGHTKDASASRNKQTVEDELKHVHSENARLNGKIRGYQTLNTLFQEEKLQCLALKKEKQELEEKLKQMMTSRETNKTENNSKSSPLKVASSQNNEAVKDSVSAVVGVEKAVDGSKVVSMGTQESGAAGWNGSITGIYQLSETVLQDSDVVQEEDFIKFNNSTPVEHYIPPTIHSGLVSSDLYGPGSMNNSLASSSGLYSLRHPVSVSHPGRPPERTPVIDHNGPDSRGGSPLSIRVADDLTNMIEKTRRLERSERAWKALAETLQSEVQEKVTKLKVEREERAHSTSLLKRENSMLLQKIKKLEHERDALSPADSVSSETAVMGADWVHVSKQQSAGPVTPESPEDPRLVTLLRRVHFLDQKNKQLSQANKDWEAYRRISESTQEEKMQELRQKLEDSEKSLTDHRLKEEKRQRDIDKILLASKKRCQELEDEREELTYELDQCKDKCKILEEQVQVAQQQQLNELSESIAAQSPTAVPVPADPHLEEIVNEKEALKQQLTIFQEDFDKERADRAKAQADKDTLQRQISEVSKQLRTAQSQQRTSDETLQTTLTEGERLQQQLATLRRQVRSSENSLQKTLHENEQLRQQLHDKMKQIRQQGVITPTQGGQPYYPPSAGQQLTPNWQGPPGMYQSARVENAPELLPGSWQCHACTYVNYPGRTVCEVCGAVNQQQQQQGPPNMMMGANPNINPYWPPMYGNQGVNQPDHDPNNIMRQQLIPRGRFRSNDLTTDSGTYNDG